MSQHKNKPRENIKQGTILPVVTLQREAKRPGEHQRRERRVGENLAEFHSDNRAETHPRLAHLIKLVDRNSRGHGDKRPYGETRRPDHSRAYWKRCKRRILDWR